MRRPHYRHSLASRVTLLTTMAVGAAIALMALAAYTTVRIQLTNSLDESLRERARAAIKSSEGLATLTKQKVPLWVFGAADVRIVFVDTFSGVMSADPAMAQAIGPPEITVAKSFEPSFSARTVVVDGTRFRMVAVSARDGHDALVLAQSLAPTERMLDRLGLIALLFGLGGMIAAAVAGWGVARNGLRPVRQLTEAAETVARTGQLVPIPVEGNDEIARLSRAFNAMLTSLSAAQVAQRQLVADAGHELRTPLTSLRTNLDLLVQAGGSDRLTQAARDELLEDVRGQINEMTTLIGDLVELAREDPSVFAAEDVDLAMVAEAAVTRVRRRAPGLNFDVHLEPWWVHGDSAALERAITNLLDNAAKWSPPGGTVTARLKDGTLLVADEGKGISPRDLPLVFDRFYRSPDARAMPGSGLGLSIVQSVADRHGGIVRAGTGPGGGAGFWFTIPGTRGSETQATRT
ncbi:MAG: HAMP domain-containing sensor histidine kinase [Marmoricola sp.]